MSGVPTQANESGSGRGRHTHSSCHLASRVITGVRILVTDKPNSCSGGLVRFVLKPTLLLSTRWLGDALPIPLHSEHTRAFSGRCPNCMSRVRLNTRTQKKTTCPAPASSRPPDQRAGDLSMKHGWQLGNAS